MISEQHNRLRHVFQFGFAALLAVLVCATGSATSARAQEVQVTGPLAGAPAVHHLRLYRKGRLELSPTFSITLQDEFSRALLVGGQLRYHFVDWLGIGGWGSFAVANPTTKLTKEIEKRGITRDENRLSLPSPQGFDKQVGEIRWIGGVDVEFVPLRGKIAMFQKIFLDTDFYLFAGLAFAGLSERANTAAGVCDTPDPVGGPTPCLDSQSANKKRTALAPSFGAGLNFYFKGWAGLTFQWRGVPFKWNTGGFDDSGHPDGDFPDGLINSKDRKRQFNHMITLGAVFYIPPKIKTTH